MLLWLSSGAQRPRRTAGAESGGDERQSEILEADNIASYFDSIDHQMLLEMLSERIADGAGESGNWIDFLSQTIGPEISPDGGLLSYPV